MSKVSEMLKSSGSMGLATMISRLLGMVREMVYASFMGDTAVASAFKLAFQIPNLFRRLLGEGALTAAFIPIFKNKEALEGENAAWQTANVILSGLLLVAGLIVILVLLGISFVLQFIELAPDTWLVLSLLRIMFPYMLLVCVAAVLIGMANSRGYFFVPAMSATMLNVVTITTVLCIVPYVGKTLNQQIYALAYAILVAGVAQSSFVMPLLHKQGFRFKWINPIGNDVVKEVIKKMIPGTLGVAAFQINVLLISGFSFFVSDYIVASFDYAVRLMELPQGVFGISLATWMLPTLSALASRKQYSEFRTTLVDGLGYLTFINVLAGVLLVVLAEPIIRLLFERGAFGEIATQRSALALMCLAPGLVFFSSVNILARAFFALGDTKTPAKISILCLGGNLVISLILVFRFRQAGLGIANTLTSFLNMIFLSMALKRQLSKLDFTPLKQIAIKLLIIAGLTSIIVWGVHKFWFDNVGYHYIWERLGEVFVPALIGSIFYLIGACILKLPQVGKIKKTEYKIGFVRGLSICSINFDIAEIIISGVISLAHRKSVRHSRLKHGVHGHVALRKICLLDFPLPSL